MTKITVQQLIDLLNENIEDKDSVIFLAESNLKKKGHIKNKYYIESIAKTPPFGNVAIIFNKDTKFEGVPKNY